VTRHPIGGGERAAGMNRHRRDVAGRVAPQGVISIEADGTTIIDHHAAACRQDTRGAIGGARQGQRSPVDRGRAGVSLIHSKG